jgi:hypothetical protein
MLGRRADWITCADAARTLALPGENPGLQSLCSLTHQGRDAPPPKRIEKRKDAAPARSAGPPPPPDLPPEEAGG